MPDNAGRRLGRAASLGAAGLALTGSALIGGIVGTETTSQTTEVNGLEFTTNLSFNASEHGKIFMQVPVAGTLEIPSKYPVAPGIEVNVQLAGGDKGAAQLDKLNQTIQDPHALQEMYDTIVTDQKWDLVERFTIGAMVGGLAAGGMFQAGKRKYSFLQANGAGEKARVAGTGTRQAVVASATSAALGLGIMGGVGIVYSNASHVEGTGMVANLLGAQGKLRGIDKRQTSELIPYLNGLRSLGELAQTKIAPPEKQAPNAVNILFVSDIHGRNRYPFMKDIVKEEGINAVVDTGDLINFGFPQELALTNMTEGIKSLGVPYLYVTGNHDSQGPNDFSVIQALVKGAPNVIPLQPNATTFNEVSVDGYDIAGFDDRGHYYTDGIDNETDSMQTPYAKIFDATFEGLGLDLAVAHEPSATSQTDVSPFTANGHTHKAAFVGTNINPGTFTGGDELRSAGSFVDALASFTACKAATKGSEGCEPPTESPSSYAILSIGSDCRPNLLTIYQYVVANGTVDKVGVNVYSLANLTPPGTDRICDAANGVTVRSIPAAK